MQHATGWILRGIGSVLFFLPCFASVVVLHGSLCQRRCSRCGKYHRQPPLWHDGHGFNDGGDDESFPRSFPSSESASVDGRQRWQHKHQQHGILFLAHRTVVVLRAVYSVELLGRNDVGVLPPLRPVVGSDPPERLPLHVVGGVASGPIRRRIWRESWNIPPGSDHRR